MSSLKYSAQCRGIARRKQQFGPFVVISFCRLRWRCVYFDTLRALPKGAIQGLGDTPLEREACCQGTANKEGKKPCVKKESNLRKKLKRAMFIGENDGVNPQHGLRGEKNKHPGVVDVVPNPRHQKHIPPAWNASLEFPSFVHTGWKSRSLTCSFPLRCFPSG